MGDLFENIPVGNHTPGRQVPDSAKRRRMTVPDFREFKKNGNNIVMVTAYDAPSARLVDRAGVDAVLVGDSVGTTVLGHSNVIPVTLEDIIHHVRAVSRGLKYALLIADLPFGSYQVSAEEAVRNAIRLLKEGGAHAVKLEGGAVVVETLRRLTKAGIPAMGHLGLTPQSIHQFGGHVAQGREPEAARQMIDDARALEAAGAFGIVLETIPAALAGSIRSAVTIPTIGIGAGPDCDGQVQVWHDLLGLGTRTFHHAKQYADIGAMVEGALRAYASEVRERRFPTEEQSL